MGKARVAARRAARAGLALGVVFALSTFGVPSAGLAQAAPQTCATPTFAPADDYVAGYLPSSTASADFTGDGEPDVLVVNGLTSSVFVYRGTGDGYVQTPLPSHTSITDLTVVVADFNRDGRLDAALGIAEGPWFDVLLGNGDGTFGAPVRFVISESTLVQGGPHLAAGDLDGDGLAELVTTGFHIENDTLRNTLSVLRNTCGRGTSLGLNGATAFASTPHSPELNPPGDWTVEAWLKDDSPLGFNHDYTVLLNKGDRTSSPESPFFISVGFKRLVVGQRTAWVDYSIATGLLGVDPNRWHHVAGVFHTGSRTVDLYLDGALVASGALAAVSAGNTLPVQIGRSGPTSGKNFLGKLDDVRIWGVARSSAEIAAAYRSELTSAPAGLLANWRFDDSGLQITDLTGRHPAIPEGGASLMTDVH